MSRIFFRTMGLILILCMILIALMQMLGNLREAGAILIAYENDGNQAYINLVFTDTGAIFMHKQTGFPNLSPDACRYVNFHVNAAAKQAEIEFFDILGQKLSQHVIPDFSTTWRNFWSPDGEYIALLNIELSSGSVMLSIVQAETGQAWQVADKAILIDSLLTWSPDSRYIAFTGYSETIEESDIIFDFQNNQNPDEVLEQQIFIYDFKKDHLAEIQGDDFNTSSQLIWSNDEGYLLLIMGNSPEKLGIIDIENESFLPIAGLQSVRSAATWSPDNQLLVAGRDSTLAEGEERLYIVNAATGTYQAIQTVPFGISFGDWTKDGQTLLYFDIQERSIRLLNMNDYSEWRISSKAGETVSYWTADNRLFSTRMSGGYLWFIEPETGQTFATEQQVKELFAWLDNEQFIYTSRDRETHLAQFKNGRFDILARYPLRQIQGLCVPDETIQMWD